MSDTPNPTTTSIDSLPSDSTVEESPLRAGPASWQQAWHEVIFEADTTAGKLFDVVLLFTIIVSIVAVMLESVESIKATWGPTLDIIEWVITLLFTFEFLARLACLVRPSRYAFSFFGIVDIVSILPTYLALLFPGAHTVSMIRTLRLLRVFRILKMGQHLKEASTLSQSIRNAWPKITVFLMVIFCSTLILGTIMYLIEAGEGSGFDNIPASVYWAIVTMTTVGYGDIAPVTALGKFVAAIVMLFGYAILAVPTGIFAAEVMKEIRWDKGNESSAVLLKPCSACQRTSHAHDANFCAGCGTAL